MDAALEGSYCDSDSGNKELFDRPDAERLFEPVVSSPPGEYSVVGRYGTVKSTFAKKAARKTPGVIHVTNSRVRGCVG